MKVSLLNPPPVDGDKFIREGRCMQSVDSWAAIWPPLALGILGSIAKDYAQVDLFDCNVEGDKGELPLDQTIERVKNFNPHLIVINTSFPSIEGDVHTAEELKKVCPDALIVGFGVFFTLLEEKSMSESYGFDIGIIGEPEDTFKELLESLDSNINFTEVPGLMWRNNGVIKRSKDREFIKDLDKLPFPSREYYKNDRYTLPHNGEPFTLIGVSRGCPYPCTYCVAPIYYGNRLRRHSLEYVMSELEECQTKYNIKQFLFWEEVFTMDRKFGIELCNAIIDKKWNISWATTTRADLVDEEILKKMKQAGCTLMGLGIETADQNIMDLSKKKEKIEDVENAVALCKKVGLATMGHFIFGLPGESKLTIEKTIKFGLNLGLDYIQAYAAVPYPKTPLGELARQKGYVTSSRWMDYNFGGYSIMDLGTVTPEDIDEARIDMLRRFYMRPSYAAKKLGMFVSNPKQILQAAKFMKWMKTKGKKS